MAGQMVRNIVEEQCTRCHGHTVVLNGAGLHVACPTCGGTGKSPVVNKAEPTDDKDRKGPHESTVSDP